MWNWKFLKQRSLKPDILAIATIGRSNNLVDIRTIEVWFAKVVFEISRLLVTSAAAAIGAKMLVVRPW